MEGLTFELVGQTSHTRPGNPLASRRAFVLDVAGCLFPVWGSGWAGGVRCQGGLQVNMASVSIRASPLDAGAAWEFCVCLGCLPSLRGRLY